jgi:hypothetical protein
LRKNVEWLFVDWMSCMVLFAVSVVSPISWQTWFWFCRHAQVREAAPTFFHTSQFCSLENSIPNVLIDTTIFNTGSKPPKTIDPTSQGWRLVVGGEMRFLQKIKFLPNVILMLETFRYILSHVKYKISATNSTGKATDFEIQHIFM